MADANEQGSGTQGGQASVSDVDLRGIRACIDYPMGQDLPSYAAMPTAKKWPNGSTLRVLFLDGDPGVQAKVAHYAH